MRFLTSKYHIESTRLKRLVFLWVLCSAFVLLNLTPEYSLALSVSDSAVNEAVGYLTSKQNSDGSWSEGDKRIVDTLEVIKALGPLSNRSDVLDALNASLPFICSLDESSNDILSRKFRVLINSTADTSAMVSALLAAQNEDGGWGLGEKKQSDIIDTIIVVESLLQVENAGNGVLSNARDFIINSQEKPNGCWILADEYGAPSDIARSAMGLIALKDIEQAGLANSSLTSAVNRAQNFLESNSDPNDSTGWYKTCADTALVYRALLRVKQPFEIQDFLAQLLSRQQSNGSWDNDIFTTALVTQALNTVSPPEHPDLADLAVHDSYIQFEPAYPDTGQDVNIIAQVINNGTIIGSNVVVEFYNRDPRLGGERIGYPCTIDEIAPGSSFEVRRTYTNTYNLYNEQLIVVVVDPNNAVIESCESNNYAAKILTFGGGKPDLKIDNNITVPDGTLSAFGPIEISAEVTNQAARFEEPFTVRLEDEDDPNINGEIIFNGLSHNQKAIATFIIGLPAGNHTINIIVDPNSAQDPNGAIDETNENNNIATKFVEIAADSNGAPDLMVKSIKVEPAAPQADEDVNIVVTVINQTGSNIDSPFWVKLQKKLDSGEPGDIGSISITSLTSGQQAILTWTNVSFETAGLYTITAIADCNENIAEKDLNNNDLSVTLNVAPTNARPDLLFTSFEAIPSSADEGQLVQLTAELKNNSPNNVNDVLIRFFDGDYQIGEDLTIPTVTGGQTIAIQYGATFTPGTKHLIVEADPNNTIAEIDDVNNTATAILVVYPSNKMPDLAISSDDIGFSVYAPKAWEPFDIIATIHNDGNALAENIIVRFIDLGIDVDDPNDDLVAPEMIIDGIGVKQTGTATLKFVNGLPGGLHTIRAIIDPNSQSEPNGLIDELNENNNEALRQIPHISHVGIEGKDLIVEALEAVPGIAAAGQLVNFITSFIFNCYRLRIG